MIVTSSTNGWVFFYVGMFQGEVIQKNWYFKIVDGHDFHVTIETLEQVVEITLDIVTLPTHISHAL
jgi:hypothetical protein